MRAATARHSRASRWLLLTANHKRGGHPGQRCATPLLKPGEFATRRSSGQRMRRVAKITGLARFGPPSEPGEEGRRISESCWWKSKATGRLDRAEHGGRSCTRWLRGLRLEASTAEFARSRLGEMENQETTGKIASTGSGNPTRAQEDA